ncbi:MAG: glycosyltransferase family 39 protein [Polyangiaceae bacterium]
MSNSIPDRVTDGAPELAATSVVASEPAAGTAPVTRLDASVARRPTRVPLSKLELIGLAVGALLMVVLHTHFRVAGFGEQDAARLASDAINWHFEHVIYMDKVDYRLHTSPLYIHALKLALDHGLRIRSLPFVMNEASVLFSSACLVGLYVLFRRLTRPAVAAAATVIYAFTPAFWLGSVYGMPTVLALTCWVFSVVAFAEATDETSFRSGHFFGFFALSAALAGMAFSLKADMALSGGALLLVILCRDRLRLMHFVAAAGVLSIGVACTLLYSHHLAAPVAEVATVVPDPKDVHGFLDTWNARFPFKWSLLIDPKNNTTITHASGTLLFAVILLALCQGFVAGGRRARFTLGAAAWGLPPMIFWGLKSGNSARHNLPVFPSLVLLASLMLFQLCGEKTRKVWLLIGLITLLGQLDTTGYGSVNPNVDLLAASRQVSGSSNALHERAREFAESPAPKKALIESEYLQAYTEFEVWAAAKAPSLQSKPRAALDGRERETLIIRVGGARAAKAKAAALRDDGYQVFSAQYSL